MSVARHRGRASSLVTDQSPVDHLAAAGFRPEFGARELRRLIRTELETQLARAMLADEVHEGDRVLARWDGSQQKVVLEPQPGAAELAAESKRPTKKRPRQHRSGSVNSKAGMVAQEGVGKPHEEPTAAG
ncbi:hypothetical protein ACRAWG_06325 [Methylobacterium sp. P31]